MQNSQGRRLRALSDAFHKTSKFALRPVDAHTFSAQFEGLEVEYVEVAYDAYLQALHRTRVLAETDFQQICEENNLRDKLYALEELCEEQGIAESDAPVQSRNVSDTSSSRIAAFCHAHRCELEELQEVLAKGKEELARQQSQLGLRQQQLRAVLQNARPIALANQKVHDASKAWAGRQLGVAS